MSAIGQSVLIVDRKPLTRASAERVLLATEAHVVAVEDQAHGLAYLRANQVNVLIVSHNETSMIAEARKIVPSLKVIIMAENPIFGNDISHDAKEPLDIPYFNDLQMIARTSGTDLFAIRELFTTTQKLFTQDIFGLEKYLGWGTDIHQVTINNSRDRLEVIDQLFNFAMHRSIRYMICHQIRLFVDEMTMNAIWNAPVDAQGKEKYKHLNRQDFLQLDEDERVLVRYGLDGVNLAVSVSDLFGRLEYEKVIHHIQKGAKDLRERRIKKNQSGGLGLYLSYCAVSSLNINVRPPKLTEVTGIFHLPRLSTQNPSIQPKSFTYFSE